VESWTIHLEEANKSNKTIRSYTDTVRAFVRYLTQHDMPVDAEGVEADHVRKFLLAEKVRTSPGSAAVHFRNLRVFFGWVLREGERELSSSPMVNVEPPKVTAKAKEFLDDEDLRALLAACKGNGFEARRDTAILRIFMDTGMRVSGLTGLRYDPQNEARNDVLLAKRRLRVRLKGGREIWVPLGKKAASALDRYLRVRARHPQANSPWLWVGNRGRNVAHFSGTGVRAMLKRRGEQAGVAHVHPHRFRATFADDYLEGGGTVDGLMAIAGWSTYDMPLRYAGERAAERARQAHAQLSPGDRI
jgi:site-specific recombinase XerD